MRGKCGLRDKKTKNLTIDLTFEELIFLTNAADGIYIHTIG